MSDYNDPNDTISTEEAQAEMAEFERIAQESGQEFSPFVED